MTSSCPSKILVIEGGLSPDTIIISYTYRPGFNPAVCCGVNEIDTVLEALSTDALNVAFVVPSYDLATLPAAV